MEEELPYAKSMSTGYASFAEVKDDVEFAVRPTPTTSSSSSRVRKLTDDSFGYSSLEGGDEYESTTQMIVNFLTRVPAIFISLLLVLFQTVSFGGIVFPGTWIWPSFIPHSLGFQIMLFATLIGQFFLTFSSSFDFAVALVMVENVQLMHGIAEIVMTQSQHGSQQGVVMDDATGSPVLTQKVFTTTMVAFASCTAVTGIMFLLLGYFKLGNIVSSFPRHAIVGLIGGIGIFLATSGFEVSTSKPFEWSAAGAKVYLSPAVVPLWMVTVGLVILLRIIIAITKWSNVTPFFFLSIPFFFYAILSLFSIPLESAREFGWFFPQPVDTSSALQPFLMWQLLDLSTIDWYALFLSLPTMLALVVFSVSHVPINVPSLSISTGTDADMNGELRTHGVFNLVSGLCFGLPSYLCYCISFANWKLGNTSGKKALLFQGRMLSIACSFSLFLLEIALFLYGPTVLGLIPRCLGGTLLLNVGLDLTFEALVDGLFTLDSIEYVSVVVITITITLYGMTQGLIVCAISSAATFVIQSAISSSQTGVIKSIRTARTLRSSRWRVRKILELLETESTSITVIQLQGYVFFANSMDIFMKVTHLLEENKKISSSSTHAPPSTVLRRHGSFSSGGGPRPMPHPVMSYLILDFTLVQSIDSSAAETIAKIYEMCAANKVRLCYSRGSILCNDFRMKRLGKLLGIVEDQDGNVDDDIDDEADERKAVHMCDSLDMALAWCEDCIIHANAPKLEKALAAEEQSLSNIIASNSGDGTDNVSRLTKVSNTYLNLFTASTSALNLFSDGGSSSKPANISSNSDRDTTMNTAVAATTLNKSISSKSIGAASERKSRKATFVVTTIPPHMLQLLALCPDEPSKVERLVARFERQMIQKGTYIWQIGDEPNMCVLLSSGCLISSTVDEHYMAAGLVVPSPLQSEKAGAESTSSKRTVEGSSEDVEILVGHLVGEYSLLMNTNRQGSLLAVEDSVVYVLHRSTYETLEDDLKLLLFRICLQYLGHKALHVSNRLLENKCVPV